MDANKGRMSSTGSFDKRSVSAVLAVDPDYVVSVFYGASKLRHIR